MSKDDAKAKYVQLLQAVSLLPLSNVGLVSVILEREVLVSSRLELG